ncbi:putative peptide zinc metalloprotease protein [Microbacterium resistens]|uniref:Peptide zinc metalloprotease protein n=1 Tax=Microbacterium resistens TaxID=156977 RepID=A0ABU1SBM0_9MICO|nr:hypothetical protein [Microbacterium resistens]MDR6866961.1 putative peptide zinc metalloprotease protein [Microbacterium resistens]
MSESAVAARSWDAAHPALADQVGVDPPLSDGAPWIISVAGVPRARVGADFARMAALFDGRRSLREAVESAGVDVDAEQAFAAVDSLAAAGLLQKDPLHGDRSSDRPSRRPSRAARRPVHPSRPSRPPRTSPPPAGARRPAGGRRLVYRPPLTVQWTLFDPTPVASFLARPFRSGGVRLASLLILAGVLVLALIAVVRDRVLILSLLGSPFPLDLVPVLLLVILLLGCVHELGHAVALAAFGGRPARMGVMLFYLTPAFFCDVTDGWRIRERSRRAAVALAGPAVHLFAGSVAFALVPFVADAGLRRLLAVVGVACLAAVVANLIPFIKLDGYLALVAITDTPNLRAAAIGAARRALVRLAFGIDERPDDPPRSWILAGYGALCTLFPLALFSWVASRMQPVLVALGAWTSAAFLLLVLVFVIALLRRIGGLVASALRHRARAGRVAFASAVAAAICGAVLLVPMRTTVHAGYVVDGGRLYIVASGASALGALSPGDAVRLRSNGVLVQPQLAVGTVVSEAARELLAPVEAIAPVSVANAGARSSVPVHAVPLSTDADLADLPRAGAAEAELATSTPLGALLVRRVIEEPLAAILEGEESR